MRGKLKMIHWFIVTIDVKDVKPSKIQRTKVPAPHGGEMSALKPRWLMIAATAVMATGLITVTAMAQDATPDASAPKPKGTQVHASGNITLTGGAPCSTTNFTCYSIQGNLTQGKGSKMKTGTVSGPLEVGPPSTASGRGTCYIIQNTSLDNLTFNMDTVEFIPTGEICIRKKKTGAGETVINGNWMNTSGSPLKGSGKFGWTITAATTSDLSGAGTTHFSGTIAKP
jgi:hypothetical protein